MIRKSFCFFCVVCIFFMSLSSTVTAVKETPPTFHELYWYIPSTMKVDRIYEEFTFQESQQLEVAAKHFNPKEGEYSHSVISPCGGAIHLHPTTSMDRMIKFYPTLRTTSYFKSPSGEEEKTLVFLTCAKNMEGEWLFFYFDLHGTVSLKALLVDQDASVRWSFEDDTPIEKNKDGLMIMYNAVWGAFEENEWTRPQELLSVCFSGKLWEDVLFSCNTIKVEEDVLDQPSESFEKAESFDDLMHWHQQDFEKTRIADYSFKDEDREALANFLNHTRERMELPYTRFNVIAYAEQCYYLEDESQHRIMYVGEITYCPIPECFKYCSLKALKDENGTWSFSYTTDNMVKSQVFLKTFGISPLLECSSKQECLYLEYLNALGLLLLNCEDGTCSEEITMLFSLRAYDSFADDPYGDKN
ncbi:MAG TPA: hypothetical protein PLE09_04040 [Caldisericia bacterium]|nr:hypothetical protein [Caldisericia bacterium]